MGVNGQRGQPVEGHEGEEEARTSPQVLVPVGGGGGSCGGQKVRGTSTRVQQEESLSQEFLLSYSLPPCCHLLFGGLGQVTVKYIILKKGHTNRGERAPTVKVGSLHTP